MGQGARAPFLPPKYATLRINYITAIIDVTLPTTYLHQTIINKIHI